MTPQEILQNQQLTTDHDLATVRDWAWRLYYNGNLPMEQETTVLKVLSAVMGEQNRRTVLNWHLEQEPQAV